MQAPERIWRPKDSQRFKGKLCDTDIEYVRADIAEDENRRLKEVLDIWHIQFNAAMRATSLGLCKRIIKHAWEDEQALKGE